MLFMEIGRKKSPLKPHKHQQQPYQEAMKSHDLKSPRHFDERRRSSRSPSASLCRNSPKVSSVSIESFHSSPSPDSLRRSSSGNNKYVRPWRSQESLPIFSQKIQNLAIREKKKKNSWFFRIRCPCSGKKSVEVKTSKSNTMNKTQTRNPNGYVNIKTQRPKSAEELHKMSRNFKTEDTRSFERLKPRINPENLNPEKPERGLMSTQFTPQNKSKNYDASFSFPILNPPMVAKPGCSLSENHPRLSLDIYKTNESSANDDDLTSDSSSDLFEIDSISTQTTQPMHPCRRDSLDEILTTMDRWFKSKTNEFSDSTEFPSEWSPLNQFYRSSVVSYHTSFESVFSGRGKEHVSFSCNCDKSIYVGPTPIQWIPNHSRHLTSATRGASPHQLSRSTGTQ